MNEAFAVVSESELSALRAALAQALDLLAVLESGLLDNPLTIPGCTPESERDVLFELF